MVSDAEPKTPLSSVIMSKVRTFLLWWLIITLVELPVIIAWDYYQWQFWVWGAFPYLGIGLIYKYKVWPWCPFGPAAEALRQR